MKPLCFVLVAFASCGASPVRPVPPTRTTAPLAVVQEVPASDEPAEPFSSAWLEAPDTWGAPMRSRVINAGACLEPLEPINGLGEHFVEVRSGLNLTDDALLSLVTAPSFGPLRALSLHRRPSGAYVLRVTRFMSKEPSSSVHERTIESGTAGMLLKLWAALAARLQTVESDVSSMDGTAYYFTSGRITGYAANPAGGSILDRSVSAMDRLSGLVEAPERADQSDRDFVQGELQEALAGTTARQPCTRVVTE
jgi:hypothetical protein